MIFWGGGGHLRKMYLTSASKIPETGSPEIWSNFTLILITGPRIKHNRYELTHVAEEAHSRGICRQDGGGGGHGGRENATTSSFMQGPSPNTTVIKLNDEMGRTCRTGIHWESKRNDYIVPAPLLPSLAYVGQKRFAIIKRTNLPSFLANASRDGGLLRHVTDWHYSTLKPVSMNNKHRPTKWIGRK
jgi:hypothetical protein